jgi:tetratricopeptide (TPR) repeat protein
VAYGSLLHERRLTLHARIVEAIERLHADRLDEHIDRLAHHALRGEVWDKATAFLRRAATVAGPRIAYGDKAARFEQALGALARLPDSITARSEAADLHFWLARSLYGAGQFDRAMAAFHDAERLALALDDKHRVARVCTGVAYLLGSRADHHGSIAAGERALALATAESDPVLPIWTSVAVAREYFAVGEYQQGIVRARAAVEALEPARTQVRRASDEFRSTAGLLLPVGARTWLALCLASLGQLIEAVTWAEAATKLADAARDPQAQVWADYTLGRVYGTRGDFAQAVAPLERAALQSERIRFPVYTPRVLASLGTVYSQTGRFVEGLALLTRAAAEGEATGVFYDHAMLLVQLGEAQIAGNPEEAAQWATRACALARQHRERGNEAWAVHLLSRAAAAHPSVRHDAALTHMKQAITLAKELGMRPLVAHCHLGLGKLYRRTDNREQAKEHLTTATTMYRDMDMGFWLGQAEAETAALA